ncbi:MAG: glutathione S-transferase family protein, partial [Deltaproteobacteria bacterium]|nr:glutathione S-transferase family protein [Deltaproteobacteria bacterium]
VLGESEVICEYLEDRFPTPSLRPEGALDRAHVRLLSRVTDLYILSPLFELLPHMNPNDRDQAVVDKNLALVKTNLAIWEDYLTRAGYSGGGYAVGDALTLADCAMVPAFFVVVNALPAFGMAEPLAATPKLAQYWQAIQKNESCSRVLAEMAEGFKARMSGA